MGPARPLGGRGSMSSYTSLASYTTSGRLPPVPHVDAPHEEKEDEEDKEMSLRPVSLGSFLSSKGEGAKYFSFVPATTKGGVSDFSVLTDAFSEDLQREIVNGLDSMLIQRPPRTTWKKLRSAKDLKSRSRRTRGNPSFVETSSTLLQHTFEKEDSRVIRPENRRWRRSGGTEEPSFLTTATPTTTKVEKGVGKDDMEGNKETNHHEMQPPSQHTIFSELTWDEKHGNDDDDDDDDDDNNIITNNAAPLVDTSDENTFAEETLTSQQFLVQTRRMRGLMEEEEETKSSALEQNENTIPSRTGRFLPRPSAILAKQRLLSQDSFFQPGSNNSYNNNNSNSSTTRDDDVDDERGANSERRNKSPPLPFSSLLTPKQLMMVLEESNCGDRPRSKLFRFHPSSRRGGGTNSTGSRRPTQQQPHKPRPVPKLMSMEEITDILVHVNRTDDSKIRWDVISGMVDDPTAPVQELEIRPEDMSFVSGVTNRSIL